jgi:hypothetical protein
MRSVRKGKLDSLRSGVEKNDSKRSRRDEEEVLLRAASQGERLCSLLQYYGVEVMYEKLIGEKEERAKKAKLARFRSSKRVHGPHKNSVIPCRSGIVTCQAKAENVMHSFQDQVKLH